MVIMRSQHDAAFKAKVAFEAASEDGAKENVHMESFNGVFKEENRGLFWS